jgi:hypothetical protein
LLSPTWAQKSSCSLHDKHTAYREISVFWVVALCSLVLVDVNQCFRGHTASIIRVWRFLSSELLRCVIWSMLTNVSEVILRASSGRWFPDDGGSMTSETLVTINQTTLRKNPEDRNLQTLVTLFNHLLLILTHLY